MKEVINKEKEKDVYTRVVKEYEHTENMINILEKERNKNLLFNKEREISALLSRYYTYKNILSCLLYGDNPNELPF